MSNESPALLRYLPAILGAVAAIASIIYVSISFDGTDQDWESLLGGVSDLKEAGELAEHVAVADENYAACIATKSTVSILGAVEDSLKAASEGECKIPDASVDVSACIAWKDTAPSGADVPATVELAILPVLALAGSAIDHSEDEAIQSWGSAVVDWIGSGKTSIIALIEDPSAGNLSFDGVTVEGCSP